MFHNYLKVFLRLFLKQTVFTAINIIGLAVGLACCLVIALYVRHELSFDRHFTNSENLYRVHSVVSGPGGATRELGNTLFPVAPLLEANFPEIVDSARWDPHASTLTIGNENFVEMEFFMVDPATLALLVAAGVVLGLLAGWYPAALMSGYRPMAVLKDPSRAQMRGLALKNVLVVLQFALAVGMVIGASVIYLQMRYAVNMEQGFTTEAVIDIVTDDRAGSYGKREVLKARLLQTAGVSGVSLDSSTPAEGGVQVAVSAEAAETQRALVFNTVDFDFFTLYDIALLAGRLPSVERSADRARLVTQGVERAGGSFVLNASGAREFGWSPEEAIGKFIVRDGAPYEVIGVVADTIQSANVLARSRIYAVPEDTEDLYRLSVKLETNDIAASMAAVESTWRDVNPGEPLTSIFMEDMIARNYAAARNLEKLVFLFAGMAVFISCMGLFGLANFNAQRRTKEIGVRKVMGGSVWQIVLLLTNDFSKLVLLSNVLAWPAAYVVMQRWLDNFAYRIDLTPLVFIGSGLIALCVAWVTVGGTAAKAASQKPVLALRYE
jgi:putative ABC transport system permease protein